MCHDIIRFILKYLLALVLLYLRHFSSFVFLFIYCFLPLLWIKYIQLRSTIRIAKIVGKIPRIDCLMVLMQL